MSGRAAIGQFIVGLALLLMGGVNIWLAVIANSDKPDAVTPALLQESFKKYFPMNRYTVVTLMPEKKAQQP